jgi:hypothetical protein
MHILLTDGGQGCLAIADQLSDPSVCQLMICRERCDPRGSFAVAMTSNPRLRSIREGGGSYDSWVGTQTGVV